MSVGKHDDVARLETAVRQALDAAGHVVPLSRPEWRAAATTSPQRRGSPRTPWRIAAAVAIVLAVGAVGIGVLGPEPTGPVRVDTAGPDPTDTAVDTVGLELPAAAGSPPVWEPAQGRRLVLAELADVRSQPVTSATFAVQVGGGIHWTWVVADAGDGRLRAALDSAATGPGALSPDGRVLAVAFPGLLQLVDLAGREAPRSVVTGPMEGPSPVAVAWSPDGRSVAVLRSPAREDDSTAASVEIVPENGAVARRFSAADAPRGIAWSSDGLRVATTRARPSTTSLGRATVIELSSGRGVIVPPGPGLIVGWSGRALLRSVEGDLPPGYSPEAPGGPPVRNGTVIFQDLNGKELHRYPVANGTLRQLGPATDRTQAFGLVTPNGRSAGQPYAVVIDLATGEEVARPVQSSPGVPKVLGLGDGSVIIAEELAGRFEVKAVDWRTGRTTPLGTLPFRDERFVFASGSQAVLPGH